MRPCKVAVVVVALFLARGSLTEKAFITPEGKTAATKQPGYVALQFTHGLFVRFGLPHHKQIGIEATSILALFGRPRTRPRFPVENIHRVSRYAGRQV
jgi:hypothetical protein